MIMCVLCYPVSIHMSQLLSTGRPISRTIVIIVSPDESRPTFVRGYFRIQYGHAAATAEISFWTQ